MLLRFIVEGRGPRPFYQVLVVDAPSVEQAKSALVGFLSSQGLEYVSIDEENVFRVDRAKIDSEDAVPRNPFGVVAASARIWVDEDLEQGET